VTSRFAPGQTIDLVEVWLGRIWEQRTSVVVEDTPELVALWTPPSTDALVAVDADAKPMRMPVGDWHLTPAKTFASGSLGLHVPGQGHSVIVIFDPPPGYSPWYINIESDLERTAAGFEYEEHVLDVLVEADLKTWRWKDEDELVEAVAIGMFTSEQAAEFRAEGERAIEWLLSRRPPYDRDWLSWQPPTEWAK
jgi:predicted RNA-binding protein associated with RNAse of E/G family